MLEIAVAVVLVAGALVALGARRETAGGLAGGRGTAGVGPGALHLPDETPDLPCPWCLAPTAEDDPCCPSCGQRFG